MKGPDSFANGKAVPKRVREGGFSGTPAIGLCSRYSASLPISYALKPGLRFCWVDKVEKFSLVTRRVCGPPLNVRLTQRAYTATVT